MKKLLYPLIISALFFACKKDNILMENNVLLGNDFVDIPWKIASYTFRIQTNDSIAFENSQTHIQNFINTDTCLQDDLVLFASDYSFYRLPGENQCGGIDYLDFKWKINSMGDIEIIILDDFGNQSSSSIWEIHSSGKNFFETYIQATDPDFGHEIIIVSRFEPS